MNRQKNTPIDIPHTSSTLEACVKRICKLNCPPHLPKKLVYLSSLPQFHLSDFTSPISHFKLHYPNSTSSPNPPTAFPFQLSPTSPSHLHPPLLSPTPSLSPPPIVRMSILSSDLSRASRIIPYEFRF